MRFHLPQEKTQLIPEGEAIVPVGCVIPAYNFDNTYFSMRRFTCKSQNCASFGQKKDKFVPGSERKAGYMEVNSDSVESTLTDTVWKYLIPIY